MISCLLLGLILYPILGLSQSEKAPDHLLLDPLINARCERYLNPKDNTACQKSVNKMTKILNFDLIAQDKNENLRGFVFIAFKKNLLKLLSSTETTLYLRELLKELNSSLLDPESSFNLWEFTQKKVGSRSGLYLSALFQDTSVMKLHLAYLEASGVRGSETFVTNTELLSMSIDSLNTLADFSEDRFLKRFYPRGFEAGLNRSLYHFYVPLYLTEALLTQEVSRTDAYRAALFLNLSYEFISAAPDYRFLLKDPHRLDPQEQDHKLRDILGGYYGARFGLSMDKGRDLLEVKSAFGRSTSEAVKLLLQ